MIPLNDENVKKYLFEGNFGLEKESLRVLDTGHFAFTPAPATDRKHIVRDFCENQTEINTDVYPSAKEALDALYAWEVKLQSDLSHRQPREMLWPFSNPPYIIDEAHIPVAQYPNAPWKESYRYDLADKYGKYKMTFSGIHINFSFGQHFMHALHAHSDKEYEDFKNQFYVDLAAKASQYGWILTALMAASPVVDISYVEKGVYGTPVFMGLSSIRCSELGYWNDFCPIFDYSSLAGYVQSIQQYIDLGLIERESELYYPIRLKPKGEYSLKSFENGISHIELRMADLNPLADKGLELKDVQFVQLFLIWLASLPTEPFSEKAQVQAAANFKNAAHFDLKTVRIHSCKNGSTSLIRAGKEILEAMMEFYAGFDEEVQKILAFEYWKLDDVRNRYAWKLKSAQSQSFVKNGLELARFRQKKALENLPEESAENKK